MTLVCNGARIRFENEFINYAKRSTMQRVRKYWPAPGLQCVPRPIYGGTFIGMSVKYLQRRNGSANLLWSTVGAFVGEVVAPNLDSLVLFAVFHFGSHRHRVLLSSWSWRMSQTLAFSLATISRHVAGSVSILHIGGAVSKWHQFQLIKMFPCLQLQL